jgi:hypothetical protein
MAGRSFGPYEVLARLATGGAANIFLARMRTPTRRWALVCLKTLLPERVADPEFVEMFIDEAKLAARLQHPSCVEIFDLGREGGTFYLAMEYIRGETLWALLSTVAELRRPLPQAGVAAILRDVAQGLHHAHELRDDAGRPYQLVHRDVSPQNVMITFDGRVKVLDFGIARAETGRAATVTGIVKGKFSYMSPEQITGGSIDRRSDVYALGIVLFECLSSRRLYRGDTPEDIARLMLEKRPPKLRELVPDVDTALEAICAKALARLPQNRFATAAEFADALDAYLSSVRWPGGPSPLAELVQQRFGARVEDRRRALILAEQDLLDEGPLVAALGARPVMELDLYPGTMPIDVGRALDGLDLAPLRARLARHAPGADEPDDRTVLTGELELSPATVHDETVQERGGLDVLREVRPFARQTTPIAAPVLHAGVVVAGPPSGSLGGGGPVSASLAGAHAAGAHAGASPASGGAAARVDGRRAETVRLADRGGPAAAAEASRPFPEVVALPIEVTGVVDVSPPPREVETRVRDAHAPAPREPVARDLVRDSMRDAVAREAREVQPHAAPRESAPSARSIGGLTPAEAARAAAPSVPPSAPSSGPPSAPIDADAPAEPPLYSAGVVIAALAFGVTLGLLGGVVLMLFLDAG